MENPEDRFSHDEAQTLLYNNASFKVTQVDLARKLHADSRYFSLKD